MLTLQPCRYLWYHPDMTNNNNKANTMNNFERAIENINKLTAEGISLKEAVVETAWEFGEMESELWGEFPEN